MEPRLEGYPGAALLLNAAGDIQAVNDRAAGVATGVAALLDDKELPQIQDLIEQAVGTPQLAAFVSRR